MAGVKTGLGDGSITYPIDRDEASVAAGSCHPAYAATTATRCWCTTCGRRLKILGRVHPLQDGLLQGRYFR